MDLNRLINLLHAVFLSQDSISSPLLFLKYINDMHNVVKLSTIHHFPADINLLYCNKDPSRLKKSMHEDLRIIYNWLCANRLSLIVAKTEFNIIRPPREKLVNRITLKLNITTLFESTKIRPWPNFGFTFTRKYHIYELRKKLNKTIGIMYQLKKCDKRILQSIYYSLFQSHLNYGFVFGEQPKISI